VRPATLSLWASGCPPCAAAGTCQLLPPHPRALSSLAGGYHTTTPASLMNWCRRAVAVRAPPFEKGTGTGGAGTAASVSVASQRARSRLTFPPYPSTIPASINHSICSTRLHSSTPLGAAAGHFLATVAAVSPPHRCGAAGYFGRASPRRRRDLHQQIGADRRVVCTM
jgi:hypothetical protein